MKAIFNTPQEANQVLELAFGRILKIGSKPSQDGDVEQYEKCKWLMMDAFEYLGVNTSPQTSSYQQDYFKILNNGFAD